MEFVDFLLWFVFACVIALAFIIRGMFIDSGKPTANPAMRIRCYSNDDYKEAKPVIRKYGKPKLTMRDTYIVGKRWYCTSCAGYSLFVGTGETPKEAYKDWLNHCVTAGVSNYVMGFNEIITTEKQP